MSAELELVSDGSGLAVVGAEDAIEQFMLDLDLVSAESRSLAHVAMDGAHSVSGFGGLALQAGGQIAAESGRWLKLTEQSAAKVRQFGLQATKANPAISHAMIGKPGDVQSWIQVVSSPFALVTNPAALASIGTMMAQRELQRSIDELRDYLAQIDKKVDDILRAQKDGVLAGMIGVSLLVDDAITIRDEVGRVPEITWSKIQGGAATIASTQAYAVRQLDGLADGLEAEQDLGHLVKATQHVRISVAEWLAVIARSVQVQDAIDVLELDRVADANPEELNRHRVGLRRTRQKRLEVIGGACGELVGRMNDASNRANQKVLFNPFVSPKVVGASNDVVGAVLEFERSLGLVSEAETAEARRWLAAVVDTRDQTFESGQDAIGAARRRSAQAVGKTGDLRDKALDAGAASVARASEATSKFFDGLADRARRRQGTRDNPRVD
ncbi:hypothetical protein [Paraoerskovia marina]|uniref:hypothetical protein n=1 Tax=Paraoerskovia marina TaxID=545619 RepID=UPI000492AF6A|nr:hypothetical protein [Paraoerskovia marina]